MVRHPSKIAWLLLALAVVASCGGGKKKAPVKPIVKEQPKQKEVPIETEADREAKRHDAALAIVPEGTSCLPTALKKDTAPQLQLAAIGGYAAELRTLGVVLSACFCS